MIRSDRIAVLGAGIMGSGIAAVYALGGYEVGLYSRTEKTLEKAMKSIREAIALVTEEGLYPMQDLETVVGRIQCTTNEKEAVQDAFYVVETISEVKEVKEALFNTLDKILPREVIISSNTSYMNIFEMMPAYRQENLAIVHWVAPPYILPLVEVVKGPGTSEQTMKALMQLHEACGKAPVRMEKYISGFILNRLQSAMNREVMGLIQNGYCTPEMMDRAVRTSLMPRGLLLGVVQRMDFNGLDNVSNGLKNKSFKPFDAPPEKNIITDMVEKGELGIKTGTGFMDYTDEGMEKAVLKRDKELIQSVKLAREFLEHPIGKARK